MTKRAEERAGYQMTKGDHAHVMIRSLVMETGVSVFKQRSESLKNERHFQNGTLGDGLEHRN